MCDAVRCKELGKSAEAGWSVVGDLREERWLGWLPAGPGTADIGDSRGAEDVAGDSEMVAAMAVLSMASGGDGQMEEANKEDDGR